MVELKNNYTLYPNFVRIPFFILRIWKISAEWKICCVVPARNKGPLSLGVTGLEDEKGYRADLVVVGEEKYFSSSPKENMTSCCLEGKLGVLTGEKSPFLADRVCPPMENFGLAIPSSTFILLL